MTKAELQIRRAELIDLVPKAPDNLTRANLQAELSVVNAEIKRLNVEEAARNKRDSAVRKALGKHEEAVNLRRYREREAKFENAERAPQIGPTRGEYILRHAKELLKQIQRIDPAAVLPHTTAILGPLQQFVDAQKAHVHEHRARVAAPATPKSEPSDDAEWVETWES